MGGWMKRSTGILAFLTVAALVAAGCGGRDDSSSSATTAGSGTTGASATTAAAAPTTAGEPAQATDIGITATEIHIGVVADVDTPISPGLSQPLVAAVKAWGDQVNANGGLAGRKVVVTFYDSKLNPDEAVNAYTQACQNEFATVGSGAFVLLNPDPVQTCKDKAGNAIGLPDVAALTIAAGAATSKSSYGIIQAGQDFTAAQPTFTVTEYGWNYYFSKLGGSAASANQIGIDPGVPGIGPGILAAGQALTELGGKFAGKVVYPDAAPQSEATPIIQKISSEGINWVASTSIAVAKLMAEARVQGLDMSKIVWSCTSQCQSPSFASQNAAAVEGLYISQLLTPFDETDVPGVKLYREGVTNDQDVSANGETAYAAALAFEDLVDKIVTTDGVNGLTRQSLLDLLATGPTVDTKGILDKSEVLGKPSPCWVTVQIQGGKFVRVDPQGTGTFTCDPKAIVSVTGNFTG